MVFEELFGHAGGGSHHHGAGPEAEMDEGTVNLGERVQGSVGDGTHLVEVSYNRPCFGAWRKFFYRPVAAPLEE